MRTTPYSRILRQGLSLAGIPAEELSLTDATLWRGWIDEGLRAGWETQPWPELCPAQLRRIRPVFSSGETVAAGAERFYLADGATYVALRAGTGHLPGDTSYWAASQTSYNADDYDSARAYVVGDQVYHPDTDAHYAAHTAGTGHAPTDTAYWGLLVPLIPNISLDQTNETPIGEVFGVYETDPRTDDAPCEVGFALGTDGILLTDAQEGWVHFRLRAPALEGEPYDATAAYAAADQMYFQPSANAAGDFYDCLTATTAGQTPLTHASKWRLVELPVILAPFASQYAYARWLTSDGQGDKSGAALGAASAELSRQADKLLRQQRQIHRPRVLSR